jgi:hypothetical protein
MSRERDARGTTTAVPPSQPSPPSPPSPRRGGPRGAAAGRSAWGASCSWPSRTRPPITAMSFNVPIAIGFGNGLGAPAGFLFATVVLTTVRDRLRRDGAAHHDGRGVLRLRLPRARAGVGDGARPARDRRLRAVRGLAPRAVLVLRPGSPSSSAFGVEVHWMAFAWPGAADRRPDRPLGHARRGGAGRHARGRGRAAAGPGTVGGRRGRTAGVPARRHGRRCRQAFDGLEAGAFGTSAAGGAAALGIFFASGRGWASRRPPSTARSPATPAHRAEGDPGGGGRARALLHVHVLGGAGRVRAPGARSSCRPAPRRWTCGSRSSTPTSAARAVAAYRVLLVVGSFACALAFHNAASRYLYAHRPRGSRGPGARRTLGAAHPAHRSPGDRVVDADRHHAGPDAAVLALHRRGRARARTAPAVDTPELVPYVNAYGILALVGHRDDPRRADRVLRGRHRVLRGQEGAPRQPVHHGRGARRRRVGMLYALYLLWTNRAFAAGYGSDSRIFQLLPATCPDPRRRVRVRPLAAPGPSAAYRQVGRTTFEEAHERG